MKRPARSFSGRAARVVAMLALVACRRGEAPPPWVDPGVNEHHSDQVGDIIEESGQPSRTGGESAGGYSSGGRVGGSSGGGTSIDDLGGGQAPSFAGTPGSATVQLLRNDIVKGREQALAQALRDAVTREAEKNGMTSIPADVMAKARRFVSRYKIIKEGATEDGNYALNLEADVDIAGLRSELSARMGGGSSENKTIELFVDNVRRSRDLRAIAATLRDDRRVREVRQQSFARNKAVLEVDTTMIPAEVAEVVQATVCEDGVTVTVSAVGEKNVKTAIVFPPTESAR